MKLFIKFALVVSMLSPHVIWAGPMDEANQAILASNQLAQSRAREAVQLDFNFALTSVMEELLSKQDFQKIKDELVINQKGLEASFLKLASMDVNKASDLKAKLEDAFEQYKDLVRSRYDNSYIPAEAREGVRESIALASRSLLKFEANCANGRGIGGLGVKAFDYPNLPSPQYEIKMSYDSGQGVNGSGYYNSSGSQAEKDRNTVVGTSWTAASITTSIAMAKSGSATVIAACQAAAPFAIAGAAVIALAAIYMSDEERVKMENEIVQAKAHVFHNSADDRTVAEYYRQECKSVSNRVSIIRTVLNTAYTSENKLKEMAEEIPDIDIEMKKYRDILIERQNIIDAFNVAIKERDSTSGEVKDKAIKRAEGLIEDLKKKDQELKEASSPEKVGRLMVAFLVNKNSALHEQISQLSFQAADMAQKKAFQTLLNLVSLVQKENFNKFLGNGTALSAELMALEKFLRVRKLFQDTLTLQIKFIFGRVEAERVKASEAQLRTQTKMLVKEHGLNPEVSTFARQVKSLVGDL